MCEEYCMAGEDRESRDQYIQYFNWPNFQEILEFRKDPKFLFSSIRRILGREERLQKNITISNAYILNPLANTERR